MVQLAMVAQLSYDHAHIRTLLPIRPVWAPAEAAGTSHWCVHNYVAAARQAKVVRIILRRSEDAACQMQNAFQARKCGVSIHPSGK